MAVLPPDPVYTFRNADLGAVNCVCFHRAERLISGTANGTVQLFDLQTNRVAHNFTLPDHQPLTTVQKHDETLHTQQRGGIVAAWSLSNAGYQLEHRMETGHTGFCRIEVVAERGWLLAPHGDAGAIVVYDMRRPDLVVATLRPPVGSDGNGDGATVEVTTDGATGHSSARAPTAESSSTLPPASCGQLMCFKYLPIEGQDYVLGCYESGDFVTWDVRATSDGNASPDRAAAGGAARIVDRQRLDECPMAVDYDPHTNRGIYGGPSDKLGVFAYARNTMRLQRRGEITLKTAGVNCVRIRPDRRVFAVGGWDGRIRVYSWSSLRPLAVLTEHKAAVSDIVYSVGKVSLWDAPVMAVAGQDGHISLWDLYN